jgi:hypothetical protein
VYSLCISTLQTLHRNVKCTLTQISRHFGKVRSLKAKISTDIIILSHFKVAEEKQF